MTIAGKINLLVVAMALLFVVVVLTVAAQREYHLEREQVLQHLSVTVHGQSDLPLLVYTENTDRLTDFLEGVLAEPAVSEVAVMDAFGEQVLARTQDQIQVHTRPSFNRLRQDLFALDTGQLVLGSNGRPAVDGWYGALSDPGRQIHLSIPVPTALNPHQAGLAPEDFGVAIMQQHTDDAGSRHVAGFVYFAVSPKGLIKALLPRLVMLAVLGISFVLIVLLLTIYFTRRITRPITLLAEAADEVAAGRLTKPVNIDGSGEISEIANILNGMVGGLSTYKSKLDVDHQLLSMKVEERTSQLSRRNEELNQAVQEVTQTKEQLRHMAYYDSLTGLPNRRLFTEQLNLLLRTAKRHGHKVALLFLDLDNFKRINDSLGHSAGDLLLREVGARLTSSLRESDVISRRVEAGLPIDVSRLGGDEFTLVLNQIDSSESAGEVANRLLDLLMQPMSIEGHELVVTPSIGIAVAPTDGMDVEGLLKAADTAMYHAKASGKSKCLFYSSDMDAAGTDRLKLETDLRKAVERGEMELYYQPQVDTRNGTVMGVEALLRWQHPDHGMIMPGEIIPLAEEMGLLGELGDWILCEACRQLKEYEAQSIKLPRIVVNVSAQQFRSNFIDRIEEVLQEYDLEPSSLGLELTEGLAMGDTELTTSALHQLKDMGVGISIDDFGTGYSSLSYLSRFPLDNLKIDRSFVVNLDESESDASLVVAIIAMAKGLDLELIAEGVETRSQYKFLTGNGAHIIQGFLFSEPVDAEALKPLLAPWHYMQQIQEIAEELAGNAEEVSN